VTFLAGDEEVVMAESSKASLYEVLSAADAAADERWSPPRTAMLVTVASAGLWALILAGGRWLIG
jgi:hypothetical protein